MHKCGPEPVTGQDCGVAVQAAVLRYDGIASEPSANDGVRGVQILELRALTIFRYVHVQVVSDEKTMGTRNPTDTPRSGLCSPPKEPQR